MDSKKKASSVEFEPAESGWIDSGKKFIAGVDEAGRGALAGPVSVGFAIFKPDFFSNPRPDELRNVNDSKLISFKMRENIAPVIRRHCLFQSVIHISSRMIDRIGINPAVESALVYAIRRSIRHGFRPDVLLIDGNYTFYRIPTEYPGIISRSIVRGDSRIFSIAAASILAKTTRDNRMIRMARFFPAYSFEINKGYGTKQHVSAIKSFGKTCIHRQSYKIKELASPMLPGIE